MSKELLYELIKSLLSDFDDVIINEFTGKLLESDSVSSRIAETNAYGWGIEQIDAHSVRVIVDAKRGRCFEVTADFYLGGEQAQDKVYAGNTIVGVLKAVIDKSGVCVLTEVTAQVEGEDAYESGEESDNHQTDFSGLDDVVNEK